MYNKETIVSLTRQALTTLEWNPELAQTTKEKWISTGFLNGLDKDYQSALSIMFECLYHLLTRMNTKRLANNFETTIFPIVRRILTNSKNDFSAIRGDINQDQFEIIKDIVVDIFAEAYLLYHDDFVYMRYNLEIEAIKPLMDVEAMLTATFSDNYVVKVDFK